MFLSNEEMWDRPLGGIDKTNEIPHWCGNICLVIFAFLCKVLFRYRIVNREVLRSFKGKSGVVMVGNHSSYLDVIMGFLAARPSQWVRFMARDGLFRIAKGSLGQVFSRVGAFPIARDSADRTSLKRAARMLKNGEVVGIFPEGTRRGKSSRTPALHAGAALIARMGKAPMIPFTIHNVDKVKVKGQRVRFPKLTLEFGQPVYLESFDFLPKAQRLEGCTWYVMRECFALKQRVRPEEVDMVSLFPETPDYKQYFLDHPIADPQPL